jgi:hypothetical protein
MSPGGRLRWISSAGRTGRPEWIHGHTYTDRWALVTFAHPELRTPTPVWCKLSPTAGLCAKALSGGLHDKRNDSIRIMLLATSALVVAPLQQGRLISTPELKEQRNAIALYVFPRGSDLQCDLSYPNADAGK